nr:hypothetical protein [Actinomadura mexicana]
MTAPVAWAPSYRAVPRPRGAPAGTETRDSPPISSSDPAATGADIRSPRTATARPVATSGSARLSVPAVAAATRPRPVTKNMYAAAVAAIPSQAARAAERGSASAGSSGSVQGSRAAPPASSVTDTAPAIPIPLIPALRPVSTLADTV